MIIGRTILTTIFMLAVLGLRAQELQVKVNINHSQISGTDISVFENLQQTIEHFISGLLCSFRSKNVSSAVSISLSSDTTAMITILSVRH